MTRSFLMRTGHIVVVTDLGQLLMEYKQKHDALPEGHPQRAQFMKKMRRLATQIVGK